MLRRVQALADDLFPEVVRLRRHLHAHPELAFEEHETARLVTETLAPLGFRVQPGVAKTGVVATLDGAHSGPTIALRADMDALPIEEANEFHYRSKHPGRMHACGHDAHTASLLGAAMILAQMQDDLKGSARLLFQPSEEVIPGGALPMIEEGALAERPDQAAPAVIFGQHVDPNLPTGTLGVRGGMYMASADEVKIMVRGTGGHAAIPHLIGPDTVLAASQIVVALQSVISRRRPPDVPSVLSIGRFIADGAHNVIPGEVLLLGTFRSMDEDWRFQAHRIIEDIAVQTAQAFGARAEVNIKVGYPALENDEAATAFVRDAAVAYVGAENVVDLDMWYASEDFAWYLKHLPGSFYRLGTRNEAQGIVHGLHTPRFTIDEDALRLGPGFMVYLTLQHAAAG